MKFGVKWNVRGVQPRARDTAREAARRSGVSVGEWLNNVIIEQAADEGVAPQGNARYDGDERNRMNDQLASAIDRLDQRLDHIIARNNFSAPAFDRRPGPEYYAGHAAQPHAPAHYPAQAQGPEAWAAPVYRNPPAGKAPGGLDDAVAEIAARQRTLDGGLSTMRPPALPPLTPPPAWYPPAPAAALTHPFPPAAGFAPHPRGASPAQDLSGLEQQLRHITEQIEKLNRPSGLEDAVGALRQELAEIGKTLTEAMPLRAIAALDGEVRALAQRIDQTRQCGADPTIIAGIERALVDIRETLRALTPAENLAGLDEAIRGLARKIDLMASTSQDPGSLQQLEAAITALRGIVSHVASNETLTKLGEEMRGLSAKIERVAHSPAAADPDAMLALEQRVAALGDQLKASAVGPLPPQLESLVKAVNEKLGQLELSRGDKTALGHLEDRIVNLAEKLDASDLRLNHLGAIERGIADLLVRVEHVRAAGGQGTAEAAAMPPVDALKRDISRTQESLESVHGTLGQVVDRLAVIENGMRMNGAPAAEPKTHIAAAAVPAAQAGSVIATAAPMPTARPAVQPATALARPEAAAPASPTAPKATAQAPNTSAKPSAAGRGRADENAGSRSGEARPSANRSQSAARLSARAGLGHAARTHHRG